MGTRKLGWVAAGLGVLTGCIFGQKSTCDADFVDWDDDLVRWTNEAGGDGTFDVATGWVANPGVGGTWDAKTGAYSATYRYSDDNYITELVDDATVILLGGGDYRAEGSYTRENVRGEFDTADYQMARTGCSAVGRWVHRSGTVSESVSTYSEGKVEVESAIYGNGYSQVQSQTKHSDGESEFDYELVVGDYTQVGDGVEDWKEQNGKKDYEGSWEDGNSVEGSTKWWRDGSEDIHEVHTIDGDEYVYDVHTEYDGSGEGTYVFPDGDACDILFEEGERQCDCGGGFQPC